MFEEKRISIRYFLPYIKVRLRLCRTPTYSVPRSPRPALHSLIAHCDKADLGLLMLCKGILAPGRMHLAGFKSYKKRQDIVD